MKTLNKLLPFVFFYSFTFSSYAAAAQSEWIPVSQMQSFAAKLRSEGNRPTKLMCSRDRKNNKYFFSVKFKKERGRKRDWAIHGQTSIESLHKKFVKNGYINKSFHTFAGARTEVIFQCGLWVER